MQTTSNFTGTDKPIYHGAHCFYRPGIDFTRRSADTGRIAQLKVVQYLRVMIAILLILLVLLLALVMNIGIDRGDQRVEAKAQMSAALSTDDVSKDEHHFASASAYTEPMAAPAQRVHVVTQGDSLWEIAKRNKPLRQDTRKYIDQMMAVNQLSSATLTLGQTLVLP